MVYSYAPKTPTLNKYPFTFFLLERFVASPSPLSSSLPLTNSRMYYPSKD